MVLMVHGADGERGVILEHRHPIRGGEDGAGSEEMRTDSRHGRMGPS